MFELLSEVSEQNIQFISPKDKKRTLLSLFKASEKIELKGRSSRSRSTQTLEHHTLTLRAIMNYSLHEENFL